MEFMTSLAVGMQKEAQDKVTARNTAKAVGSGSLPVYATPAMTGLMEKAAAELAQKHMPEGWTTVGITLSIAHKAATPVGMAVRAAAKVTKIEGRKISYQVTAFDEREEIGSGIHERFAVQEEKFLDKAQKK